MDTWLLITLLGTIACLVFYANVQILEIRRILDTVPKRRSLEEGGMSLHDEIKIRWGLLRLLDRFPAFRNDDEMLDAVAKFLDIHLHKWEIEKYGDISLREYLEKHQASYREN